MPDFRLRHYQQAADDQIEENIARGVRRNLIVSATGSGKGSHAAYRLWKLWKQGLPSLFCVHRAEILYSIYDRLTNPSYGLCVDKVGMILGEDPRRDPSALIQLASVDSLVNREFPDANELVMDEAHRSLSKTQQNIMDRYDKIPITGYTGSPRRLDGKGLGDRFDALIMVAQPSQLIREGHIIEPDIYGVDESSLPDVSDIEDTGGDFNQKKLAHVMEKPYLVGAITEHWIKRAENRLTVVFAVGINHSKMIVDDFKANGIHAEHVDGSMPKKKRDDIINRFRAGEFRVLVQCNLLVEGVDIPEIKCVVWARPTKSLVIFLQGCGRAMRPSGEQSMLILDHAGNVARHGYPHADREWELHPKRRKKGSGAPPTKTCKECYKILPASAKVCDDCGYVFAPDTIIEVRDGELVQYGKLSKGSEYGKPDEDPRSVWDRLGQFALANGKNRPWMVSNFRSIFGKNPPDDWKRPERPPESFTMDEKVRFLTTMERTSVKQGYGRFWAENQYRKKFGEDPPAIRRLAPAPSPAPTEVDTKELGATATEPEPAKPVAALAPTPKPLSAPVTVTKTDGWIEGEL